LPMEILAHIMRCLPFHQLRSTALTCKLWNECYLYRIANNKISSLILPPFWTLKTEGKGYIEIPASNSTLFKFMDEFSMEIRVRARSPGPLILREMCCTASPTTDIHLSQLYEEQPKFTLQIYLNTSGYRRCWRKFIVAYAVPRDQWCLISISFARPYLYIYMDGKFVKKEEYNHTLAVVNSPFRIGGAAKHHNPELGIDADLQEVRFWNHGRTPNQIGQYHDVILHGKHEEGLIAYYFCNGEKVSDLTSNRHLTLVQGQIWNG